MGGDWRFEDGDGHKTRECGTTTVTVWGSLKIRGSCESKYILVPNIVREVRHKIGAKEETPLTGRVEVGTPWVCGVVY